MKIDKKIFLSWTAVGLWMLMIFIFSAQPAEQSGDVSMEVTSLIIRVLKQLGLIADANTILLDYIIRKIAHAVVYFVLTMLAINAFLRVGVKEKKAFIFAFIFTILYACSDELHQQFVPGRAGMWSDIGIDTLGALLGLGVFFVFRKIISTQVERGKFKG